jgi:Uma2 family endonuclease
MKASDRARRWYRMNVSVDTLIPVEEYLNTSYDPDVEYVDGVLVERNVGDLLHGLIQRNLTVVLTNKYPGIFAIPELRSQTGATRYRLPDICVMLQLPKTRYLDHAAYVAIEILSEDDRVSRLMEKLEEYDRKGVANVWVIDPRLRTMYVYSNGVLAEVREGGLATIGEPRLELTRDEIFRDLE